VKGLVLVALALGPVLALTSACIAGGDSCPPSQLRSGSYQTTGSPSKTMDLDRGGRTATIRYESDGGTVVETYVVR